MYPILNRAVSPVTPSSDVLDTHLLQSATVQLLLNLSRPNAHS